MKNYTSLTQSENVIFSKEVPGGHKVLLLSKNCRVGQLSGREIRNITKTVAQLYTNYIIGKLLGQILSYISLDFRFCLLSEFSNYTSKTTPGNISQYERNKNTFEKVHVPIICLMQRVYFLL